MENLFKKRIRIKQDGRVRMVNITNQDIDDIVCGALEGGITHWCNKAEVVEDSYYGEYASEQISRGGSLRLYDMYEKGVSYVLDLERLIAGVKRAYESECFRSYWLDERNNINTYMIDALACDVIVQFALFSELIYG